jgi:GntP family gluconate:H+ symporter
LVGDGKGTETFDLMILSPTPLCLSFFGLNHNASLLGAIALSVALLIILVAVFKVHAFIALTLASLTMGLCSGMNGLDTAKSFQEGVGAVLASIAVVVGLGTILGKLLAESRGAETIVETLRHWLGDSRANWSLFIVGLLVGIPAFFGVGLVLLVPILFTSVRQTGQPLLRLALPMLAALSTMHGLVPPHPGPIAVIDELRADLGKTVLYSLIIGIPTAIIAGPMLARLLQNRVTLNLSGGIAEQMTAQSATTRPPFGIAVLTLLLPVFLMLFSTVVQLAFPAQGNLNRVAQFLGHPTIALLAAVLLAFYTFGIGRGFSRDQLLKFANDCLGPVATILLIVGAGGGFNRVINDSGAGKAIVQLVGGWHLSPLILGWLVAALIRVATGSATVAIKMAGGILAPVALADPAVRPELLVITLGAGSLVLSHVNDGGFWIVKEYLNMSIPQMFKTWTVMETVISVVALLFALLLNAVL